MQPEQTTLTSVGQETPSQTSARARKLLEPTVSATQLNEPVTPVTVPEPLVNTNDGSRTSSLIDNVVNNNQNTITSQSENARQRDEIASLLGNQTFDASGQRTALGEQFGLPTNLARLTDIQTQLSKANTQSGLNKVEIESGGQSSIQGQRSLTQEDRENAVRNAGLAAEASVLQGSIETASTIINSAMQDYYSDRQLTNQNMIQQLNYFSGLADEETKQLLEQEKRVYEADQKKIERVLNTTDAAVVSGAATPEEIGRLSDPKITDDERLTIAQDIVARKARQEFNLEQAIKGRQYDLLGLDLQTANAKLLAAQQAEESGVLTPEQFEVANDLRNELNNRQFYKDAQDLEANTGSLLIALDQEDGVSDISAINTFQRLVVDPGVAVREGDVALLQSAMSFTDRATLVSKGLMVGDKLTPTARAQMKDLVSKVYDARIAIVDENSKPIRTLAQEQGIDYGKYIGKNFASYDDILARINPETAIQWGVETEGYLDNVLNALSNDPSANPFGVPLN